MPKHSTNKGVAFATVTLPLPQASAPSYNSAKGQSFELISPKATQKQANLASARASKLKLKPASDVLAGALARGASQCTIHPLDTLKVKLQTKGLVPDSKLLAKGVAPAAALKLSPKALAAGFSTLYRGCGSAAGGAGIVLGAYFAFYGAASNALIQYTSLPASGVAFFGGAIAAAGSTVVKVPIAVCIRSVQAGVYPNVVKAASSITARGGPCALLTGYFPTMIEDVPDMAFKFAMYESLRNVHQKFIGDRKQTPQEDFALGAVSGAFAAGATTPLDVIKTNMMCNAANKPSMVQAFREVYKMGGAKAFLKGLGPRSISNGINSAVFFAFFEMLKRSFAQHKARAEMNRAEVASVDRMYAKEASEDKAPLLLGSISVKAGDRAST